MRPLQFPLRPLVALFQRRHAVTMPEMKAALGTAVDATVFRNSRAWIISRAILIVAPFTR
jgi:hypothetical protein